jgi:hypothetical protein
LFGTWLISRIKILVVCAVWAVFRFAASILYINARGGKC